MEWKPLQVKTEGFELSDLLDSNFMKSLESEFKNKRISVTSIRFSVMDEEIDKNSGDTYDSITLWNQGIKDDLLKRVIVDVTIDENLDKIISVLNKIED